MRSSATSASGSLPMRVASSSRPSASVTNTGPVRGTTCSLVSTSPASASTMTPDPRLRGSGAPPRGARPFRPSKKRRKNGSSISGFACAGVATVETFTTAGVTASRIGARLGSGVPATSAGSAAASVGAPPAHAPSPARTSASSGAGRPPARRSAPATVRGRSGPGDDGAGSGPGRAHHSPVFSMLFHGSAGSSESPSCSSSNEMPSGERTKAMWPSRGGRLIVTPPSMSFRHVA